MLDNLKIWWIMDIKIWIKMNEQYWVGIKLNGIFKKLQVPSICSQQQEVSPFFLFWCALSESPFWSSVLPLYPAIPKNTKDDFSSTRSLLVEKEAIAY